MRLKLGANRSLQLRSRLAQDLDDNRGVYAIGEVAYVQSINGTDYVTSCGPGFRNDDIPITEIVAHNKAREAAEAAKRDSSND